MRIAVVTPIPTPYRDPFWNVLARRPDVDLTVLYCSSGKSDRPWTMDWSQRFSARVLPGANLFRWRGDDASCFWNRSVCRELTASRPDVILVGGFNHLTMWAAMLFAVRHNIPFLLMSETYQRRQPKGILKRQIKRLALGWIARHCAGGLPTGRLAAGYLRSINIEDERQMMVPNVPDIKAIAQRAEGAELRDAIRQRHGVPESRPLILFAGRMIPKKRVTLLLEAFAAVVKEGVDAHLALVGDGPQRSDVERRVHDFGLTDRVIFPGFVQPSDTINWYAAADLFVLPSSETWGVAVLEALAAGLPVIISDEVGCGPDVLTERDAGQITRAGDLEGLVSAIRHQLQQPPDRALRRTWSLRHGEFTYEMIGERLVKFLARNVSSRDIGEVTALGMPR